MATRDKPTRPSVKRDWFVYQITEAESNALVWTSSLFVSDTPLFKPLEKHVRQLAKSFGYDQYIMLGRDGHMFFACVKEGSPESPTDRELLMKWAEEDRTKTNALKASKKRVE